MTPDDTKLNYISSWDIDQLIAQNSVSVAASGDTVLYTIANASTPNVFEVMFQPTGSSYWYQAGLSSSDGLNNDIIFYVYINGSSLTINTLTAGTARYYIWSDKVNY